MAKIPIDKGVGDVRFSGYFDFPGLYQLITKWASGQQFKIFEKLYKDKMGGEGFREREIGLVFIKKADRMNKYKMEVTLKLFDCKPVEITKDNKVQKLESGRMKIDIQSEVEKDYQGVFKNHPKLGAIVSKLTTWEWIFDHYGHMFEKQYELQAKIKEFLGMDTV